jgi:hypothetical protein
MRITVASAGLVAILSLPLATEAQTMKLGPVLIVTESTAAPATAPGPGAHVLRADRGNRKGQYLVAWSGTTRPSSDPMPGLSGKRIEYRLLSPDKAGAPPDVDILGVHFIKVRPDRREAFERFVAERLHPAVGNLRPDLRLLYYEAAGADEGSYITIFALTTASRDKYWPKGSDSDDVRAAFAPVRALTKELATYLVEGSYATDEKLAAPVFESREWTDFVLLSR